MKPVADHLTHRITNPSSSQWEQKYDRIKRQYSPTMVQFICSVERAYADDDGSFVGLYSLLEYPLQRKARSWHRRIRWMTISIQEIQSALWERAWLTCEQYRPGRTQWLLYEQIRSGCDNTVRDLCRRHMTQQQQFERDTVALDELLEEQCHTEDAVIDSIAVQQFVEQLSSADRYILSAVADGQSLRQIASTVGTDYRTVRHRIEQLRQQYHSFISE